MAILKSEVRRVTMSMPNTFLKNLDEHLKKFALTDRSRWLIDAAREKMAKEIQVISDMEEESENED